MKNLLILILLLALGFFGYNYIQNENAKEREINEARIEKMRLERVKEKEGKQEKLRLEEQQQISSVIDDINREFRSFIGTELGIYRESGVKGYVSDKLENSYISLNKGSLTLNITERTNLTGDWVRIVGCYTQSFTKSYEFTLPINDIDFNNSTNTHKTNRNHTKTILKLKRKNHRLETENGGCHKGKNSYETNQIFYYSPNLEKAKYMHQKLVKLASNSK